MYVVLPPRTFFISATDGAAQLVELTRRVNAEVVDSGLLKDRKKSLKTYKAAFEVTEFVQWLTAHSNCGNKQTAEEIAHRMLQAGFIEVRPRRRVSCLYVC